jgi:hypothetical protein
MLAVVSPQPTVASASPTAAAIYSVVCGSLGAASPCSFAPQMTPQPLAVLTPQRLQSPILLDTRLRSVRSSHFDCGHSSPFLHSAYVQLSPSTTYRPFTSPAPLRACRVSYRLDAPPLRPPPMDISHGHPPRRARPCRHCRSLPARCGRAPAGLYRTATRLRAHSSSKDITALQPPRPQGPHLA